MTEHIEKMADDVFTSFKSYISKHFGPVNSRLDALEKRQPEKGEDGKSVDLAEFSSQISTAAAKAVEALPKPRDGIDYDPSELEVAVQRAVGSLPKAVDGKDADAEAIAAQVLDKVTKALDTIPAAKDGKDADPEFVRSVVRDEVSRAVQALPPPQAGKDGASVDMVALSGEVMAAAAKAVAALPVPKDGRDFDPVLLKAEVARAVALMFELIPKPANGTDGIDGQSIKGDKGEDGKNADPEFTKQLISHSLPPLFAKAQAEFHAKCAQDMAEFRREAMEVITTQIKAIPPAPAGKDADPEVILRMVKDAVSLVPAPRDGQDAPTLDELREVIETEVERRAAMIPIPKDGRNAPSLDELRPILEAEVERRMALVPIPKDGKDGRDGPALEDFRPMLEGEVAKAAALIPPGRDGRDAAGKDGKDGLGFEDIRVEYDGERSFALVFERGTERKEFPFSIPVTIDRGVYESVKTYERGDSFTYGGSIFITQRRNMPGEKPGDDSGAFRLSVKRGRDGKDAA